ncbi:MAG: hypothetical protein A3J75_00100 [Acidobacteria bacterium RBG_16_68_9]|nr:MAG: hypothetical protein A3J75_00100 [Acidobacteria bacterium RBG_16_68_9]
METETKTHPSGASRRQDTTSPTVSLTDKAIEQLRAAMRQEGTAGHGLRVGVRGGGCSGFQYHLAFEENPTEEDSVFELGGVLIFVDQASAPYLNGVTIDYVNRLHGGGFKFLNPNASRTCGCGSSFTA